MEMWKFSNLGNYGIHLARIDYVVMSIVDRLILHINPSVEYQ